jgi:hypothetical protein
MLVAARQNYARWRVNQVVVEEAQEASDVVMGMFFVNTTFVVVLFDFRASHSFILSWNQSALMSFLEWIA